MSTIKVNTIENRTGSSITIGGSSTTSLNLASTITGGTLTNTPAWKVYDSAGQTGLAFNTYNTITFDTVDFDTESGFNTGTSKYVVPTTGKYYLNFQFGVTGASANLITIFGEVYNETSAKVLIRHREVTSVDQSSGGQAYVGNINGIVDLTASDSLYCRVYCFASSGTLTINYTEQYTFFSGCKLIGV